MNAIKSLLSGLNINILSIGLAIALVLMTLLWRLEVSSHKLTKTEYEANAKAQEARNAIELKQREGITNDVVTSYAESINKLKEYYENNPNVKYRTIRVQDATTCTMPATSESASRVDQRNYGTQETVTANSAREVQLDMPKASAEIVQCLELIEFEKRQGSVE